MGSIFKGSEGARNRTKGLPFGTYLGYFGVLVGLLGLLGSSIGATLGVELASKNLVSGTPFRRVRGTRLSDASLGPIWGTLKSFWAAWVPNWSHCGSRVGGGGGGGSGWAWVRPEIT